MSRELIYLGIEGDSVRLALADLSDLTPRNVPVKRIPKTDFNQLLKDEKLEIVGYVKSISASVSDDTYISVADVDIKPVEAGTTPVQGRNYGVKVFISGAGKLRVFHPEFLGVVQSSKVVTLRQKLKTVSAKSLLNQDYTKDIDELYSEYITDPSQLGQASYLYQVLLTSGLWGILDKTYYIETIHFQPVCDDYDEKNPYKVRIPRLKLSRNMRHGRSIRISLTEPYIEELIIDGFYNFSCEDAPVHMANLNISVGSNLDMSYKTDVTVDKIRRVLSAPDGRDTGKCINIQGISKYPGAEALSEAVPISFGNCFNEIAHFEGDLVIPDRVRLHNSFRQIVVDGKVIIGKDSQVSYSFDRLDCKGVIFKGSTEEDVDVTNSFMQSHIRGDVDLSKVDHIFSSFSGVIQGDLRLSPELRTLEGTSFTGYSNKNYTLGPTDKRITASLKDPEANLTVIGDKGYFTYLDVANLTWHTEAEELYVHAFGSAKHIMSNEVPSIKTLARESFSSFKGDRLDFRLFTGLETIETRAINDAEELSTVILGGKVKLSPGAFTKCPKLAHIFIGDEVTGVTAAAFKDLAPVVNLYFNNNKSVERLGKLARFKLHPNSTPDTLDKIVEEIQDKFEAAQVVAVFADIQGILPGIRPDKKAAAQAVILSLTDTGMCENLAERYPIKPSCSIDTSTLDWVKGAVSTKYVTSNKREEVVRTLVALATIHYPYCESVLKYAFNVGKVIIESDKYSFIRSSFLYSGVASYAYVICDKDTSKIIHSFTMGVRQDDIEDVAAYLPYNSQGEPCSIMQYAEDIELMPYYSREFTQEAATKLRKAIEASWLPFGSFKVGTRYGIYGVDLYSGDYVVYPYSAKDGVVRYNSNGSAWWTGRILPIGHVMPALRDKLQPLYAGKLDEVVLRMVNQDNLPPVTAYDLGKIPMAQYLANTKVLSAVFHKSIKIPVDEAAELLMGTELYRRDNRITSTYVFKMRKLIEEIQLSDGVMSLYELKKFDATDEDKSDNLDMNVINLKNSDGKEQWFVGVGRVDVVKELLQSIVTTGGKTKSPSQNLKHYVLTEMHEDLEMICLSRRTQAMYNQMGINGVTHELCLGVSPVSYKACIYFECLDSGSSQDKTVLFWFNSIKDAIKGAGEIDFTPQSTNTQGSARNMRIRIMPDYTGKITFNEISNTIKAIRQGKPSGSILLGLRCNQVLFDLASKQPKMN